MASPRNMCTTLLLVSLLASAGATAWTLLPWGETREYESTRIHTLGHIKRIAVQIRGTNSREWERYGFTDTELREAITRKLEAAGFEVAGPNSSLSDPDTVILEVAVHVNDQAFYNSFLVFLRLKDKLPLPQNPQSYITETAWSDWQIGGFEPYNYRKLRATILSLVDGFLGRYTLGR